MSAQMVHMVRGFMHGRCAKQEGEGSAYFFTHRWPSGLNTVIALSYLADMSPLLLFYAQVTN
jgi:hypothetical protein